MTSNVDILHAEIERNGIYSRTVIKNNGVPVEYGEWMDYHCCVYDSEDGMCIKCGKVCEKADKSSDNSFLILACAVILILCVIWGLK